MNTCELKIASRFGMVNYANYFPLNCAIRWKKKEKKLAENGEEVSEI